MSLEKKLQELKEKENAQARAIEEERKRKEDELQRQLIDVRENILPAIRKITLEKIQPTLESVNQVYCDGRGEIIIHDFKLSDNVKSSYELRELETRISLSWGEWSDGGSRIGSKGGKRIDIRVTPNECFVGEVAKILNNNPNFLQKLEDAIYLAISTGKCEWHDSWDNSV